MEKVVAIRLLTGEEVIGTRLPAVADGMFKDKVRLRNPASITITPPQGPNKPPGIGLAPYMPYFVFDQNIVAFNEAHIMFMGSPDPRLEEGYRRANKMVITGSSGLVMP